MRANVTLTLAEASQLISALMEARGFLSDGRRPDAWEYGKGYTGKPLPQLAAAQKMLAEKL